MVSAQKNLTEERIRIVSQILLLHHPLLSEPVVLGLCGERSEEPDGGEDEDCFPNLVVAPSPLIGAWCCRFTW